jgi:wobble nucleotide-excising tRNase
MTLIKNIESLSDFGIFQKSAWPELSEFKKFNLIYGWNRCGKTTLSRVFSSCEKKSTFHIELFRQFPKNGEFEIALVDKTFIKSKEIGNSNLPIRVFNQDFIEDNVSFEPNISSNGIVYLSEEDIESKKKLDKLIIENKELTAKYDLEKKNKDSKEKIRNLFLQSVGREVSNILFDKTYNKTNVEPRIKQYGIDKIKTKILEDEVKQQFEEKVKRKVGKEISKYKSIEIKIPIYGSLDEIYISIKNILSQKVVSQTIEKLKDDEELNNWVKKGFEIHKSKEEYVKCLFCENPLSTQLFDIFSKHFSKDYLDLQNSIEVFIGLAQRLKFSLIPIDNAEIYSELKSDYISNAEALNSSILAFTNWLNSDLEGLLSRKSANPFDKDLIDSLEKPSDF